MNSPFPNLKNIPSWCFALPVVLWIVYLVWSGFMAEPSSLHFIRQTDSISFVFSYLNRDSWSIYPATLNLSSNEGKAACEFPILYYIAARISSLGSSPVATLKTIHFLLFTVGVFYIARLFYFTMKSGIAIFFSLILIFSSTILLYYSNNLLPDIPALGLTMAGLSLGARGLLTKDFKFIQKSCWFFLFAALFKITYGLYPLAIIAAWLFQEGMPNRYRLIQSIKWTMISLVPAIAWACWVNLYNHQNNSEYFLTSWSPIWKLDGDGIIEVLDYISRFWRVNFYYPTTIHFIGVTLLTIFILRLKMKNPLFQLFGWLLIGSLFFFLLFFEKFKDHDYYLLVFIPTISVLLCTLWQYPWIHKTSVRLIVLSSTGVIAILSMNYAAKKLDQRFNRPPDEYSQLSQIFSDNDANQYNEIPKDENVMVLGDHTMNGSLIFLNRKGITLPGSNLSQNQIQQCISQNEIRKLVLIGESQPNWEIYMKNATLISMRGEIKIYEFNMN